MLQGPTLRILLQLRCPEIIDVTGRVAARIPCANSRHFDEFACFLSILSRYVVSALAKEPCTYHIPFLHLFFRRLVNSCCFQGFPVFGTVATQCLRWRQEQSLEDSQVETVQAGNLGTETEATAAMFGTFILAGC